MTTDVYVDVDTGIVGIINRGQDEWAAGHSAAAVYTLSASSVADYERQSRIRESMFGGYTTAVVPRIYTGS
jgi:hypothetical protein